MMSILSFRSFLFLKGLLMVSWLLLFSSMTAAAAANQNLHTDSITMTTPPIRPTIYTYFERIPLGDRTTGMSDDDDDAMMQYWKDVWRGAGWNPIQLSLEDAKRHSNYSYIQSQLSDLHLDPFCQTSLRKWLAMASVGGGWFAEYDVFPLFNFNITATNDLDLIALLPNGGMMTVHDIVSPSLASGTEEEWYNSLVSLLEDARNHTTRLLHYDNNHDDGYPTIQTFWTDSMGIHSIQQQQQRPVPTTIIKSTRQVILAYERNDPVHTQNMDHCRKIIGKKWAVHVSQLQRALNVPTKYRLPKYRLTLAKYWLSKFYKICSSSSSSSSKN